LRVDAQHRSKSAFEASLELKAASLRGMTQKLAHRQADPLFCPEARSFTVLSIEEFYFATAENHGQVLLEGVSASGCPHQRTNPQGRSGVENVAGYFCIQSSRSNAAAQRDSGTKETDDINK
jgi:hypothetical protein